MKKITITIIMMIITIVVSGCMFFKKVDKNYDQIKKEVQKTLEEKYSQEFEELEVVSTTRGPIPGTSFDVVFKTHPMSNDEQVFKVYASSTDGKKLSDTYYWYLVKDEYSVMLNTSLENVLAKRDTEYFYYFVNDEDIKYGEEITGETKLADALENQVIYTNIYVFIYQAGISKDEFIELGNDLVNELKCNEIYASIRLRSALDSTSYDFLRNNATVGANELTPYLYMSYANNNTMNTETSFNFRFVNKQ